jgi:DNA topoisomerase-3
MLKDYSVSSPILTAQWEKKLGAIEEGEYDGGQFSKELNQYITDEVASLKNAKTTMQSSHKGASETAFTCPWCGNPVMESENYYYCKNYGKEEGKCNFIVGKKTAGAKITSQDMTDLLMKGQTEPKMFVSKAKKKFSARLSVNKDEKKIEFVFDKVDDTTDIICMCGNRVSYKSGKYGPYYQCSNCGKIISEKYSGKKLSKKVISSLYEGKETLLEGLTSKSGKTYSAFFKLGDKLEFVRFAEKQENKE